MPSGLIAISPTPPRMGIGLPARLVAALIGTIAPAIRGGLCGRGLKVV